jgi:hypothetical protein
LQNVCRCRLVPRRPPERPIPAETENFRTPVTPSFGSQCVHLAEPPLRHGNIRDIRMAASRPSRQQANGFAHSGKLSEVTARQRRDCAASRIHQKTTTAGHR